MIANSRKLTSIGIMIVLAISMMSFLPVARAATATLSLTPATINGPPPDFNQQFTVTLHIDSAADLWQWKVGLSWDPAVLTMVGAPVQVTTFMTGGSIFLAAPAGSGSLPEVSNTLLSAPGVTGSGDLATFTFKVVGYGDTTIAIVSPTLKDSTSQHVVTVPQTTGTAFHLPVPPAHGPVAAFSPADATYYYVGDTIAVDATASAGGYDTLPAGGATNNPITSYAWTLKNGPTTIASFSGVTGTYLTTGPMDITISLTVTAPDTNPPTSPDYSATSTLVKTVHVVARPSGPSLDVYTERGGQFAGVASDAYGPQELIIMHGLVKYNDVPVVNKDVAFEVINAAGVSVAYVTARTNDLGIATAQFRPAWPDGSNPESVFGTWIIKGTVDVSQVVKTDQCPFTFDYIIKILSIQTQDTFGVPQMAFHRTSMVRSYVTYRNIRSVPVSTVIAVTLYDEANVPINAGYVTVSVPAGTTTAAAIDLAIPTYAFVGTGAHAYADSFSLLPHNMGVPFCPEKSVQFTILV